MYDLGQSTLTLYEALEMLRRGMDKAVSEGDAEFVGDNFYAMIAIRDHLAEYEVEEAPSEVTDILFDPEWADETISVYFEGFKVTLTRQQLQELRDGADHRLKSEEPHDTDR